jgi:hypothetical protein
MPNESILVDVFYVFYSLLQPHAIQHKEQCFFSTKNLFDNLDHIPLLPDLKQLVAQVFSHVASTVDQLFEDWPHQVQVMVKRIQYLVEESNQIKECCKFSGLEIYLHH